MHNSSQHSLVACRLLAFDFFFRFCLFLFCLVSFSFSLRFVICILPTTARSTTTPGDDGGDEGEDEGEGGGKRHVSFSSRAFGGSRAVVEVVE